MKAEASIAKRLGMSQSQISSILRVSRSQWSMFELGERSLPVHAMKILAPLLVHAQELEGKKTTDYSIEENLLLMKELEKQLLDTNYNLVRISRMLQAAIRKHEMIQKRFHLGSSLKVRAEEKSEIPEVVGVLLTSRGDPGNAHKTLKPIVKLRLRMELLENEKAFLETRLKELGATAEKYFGIITNPYHQPKSV